MSEPLASAALWTPGGHLTYPGSSETTVATRNDRKEKGQQIRELRVKNIADRRSASREGRVPAAYMATFFTPSTALAMIDATAFGCDT